MIESISCHLYGAALIFGLFGPTALPEIISNIFQTSLLGPSLFTTFLMALQMYDGSRMVLRSVPSRPILKHFRIRLILAAVFCFSWELVVAYSQHGLRSNGVSLNTVSPIVFLALIFSEVYFGYFFFKTANALEHSLSSFLGSFSRRKTIPKRVDDRIKNIRHVRFWVLAKSFVMFVHPLLTLVFLYAIVMYQNVVPEICFFTSTNTYFAWVLTNTMLRTAASYSRVQISKGRQSNNFFKKTPTFDWKCVLGRCSFTKRVAEVAPGSRSNEMQSATSSTSRLVAWAPSQRPTAEARHGPAR